MTQESGDAQSRHPAAGQTVPLYPNLVHSPPEHPQAVAVLVLGIIGITVIPPIAPVAWALGSRVLRQIDATPGAYSRRDLVLVGRILGMLGTALFGLVLLLILYFVLTGVPPSA